MTARNSQSEMLVVAGAEMPATRFSFVGDLGALHRGDLGAHLTELAQDFVAAAVAGDSKKAIDYATRAGLLFVGEAMWKGGERRKGRGTFRLASRASRRSGCREASQAGEGRVIPLRAAPPPAAENSFRRDGEYWTIAFEGKVIRLKDSRGLRHLAELLGNPGREILSLGLAATGREAGPAPVTGAEAPILDEKAKSAYRRRLRELDEEAEEARSFNDLGRLSQTESEIELLKRQLAAAIGLGGRHRRSASNAERARASVTLAIKSALKRITEQCPALGLHLTTSISDRNPDCPQGKCGTPSTPAMIRSPPRQNENRST